MRHHTQTHGTQPVSLRDAMDRLIEQAFTFRRELCLPTEFDVDKAQASFGDGVLCLTLPKAARARPKRLTMQAGTAGK